MRSQSSRSTQAIQLTFSICFVKNIVPSSMLRQNFSREQLPQQLRNSMKVQLFGGLGRVWATTRMMRKMVWGAVSSCDVDFHFHHTFLLEFEVRSLMQTEGGRKYVLSAMQTEWTRNEAQNSRSDPYADGICKKSSVHKCQKLAILDQTLLSIRQGP